MADPVTTAAAALTLAGTAWIIDTGGALPADQSPSIAFKSDGAISGFAGCNTYQGSFEQNGTKIVIKDIAPSLKSCDDMVMIREISYLNSLKDSEVFVSAGTTLTLKRQSGLELQKFVKAPGQ
jgi:heat shock protein HslJ